MRKKMFWMAALAVGGLSAAAVPAKAASVADMIKTGNPFAVNVARDDSREGWIDVGGNGVVDVGDKIQGYFRVDALNGIDPRDATLGANAEWTGAFQLVVTNVTTVGSGANAYVQVQFGADATYNPGNGAPVGAAIVMYEDTAKNLTNFASPATATDGTYFWALGFGPTSQFVARSSLGVTAIPTSGNNSISFLTELGRSEFALDLVDYNASNLALAAVVPLIKQQTTAQSFGTYTGDFVGFSQLYGTSGVTTAAGYDISDNLTVQFNVAPVPQAAFAGTGLMGLMGAWGFLRRRRG